MTSTQDKIGTMALRLVKFTPEHQSALEMFYNAFEPKGAALGLPPRTPEAVHEWIESLRKYPNFLMMDGARIVGHSLLCPDTYTGEVAVFVQEGYRGRGIGKRLLRAVIAEAVAMDLRRVWGVCEPDNVAMLRLAHSCGFQPGKDLGDFSLDLTAVHSMFMPSLGSKP